jgi:hypothetical protein
LFAAFRRLRLRRKTRYGWVASPYPTGTFTPQEAPSLSRRDNATLQAPPRAEARHERRLLAVACKRLFGLVAPPACPGSPTQAALVMGLCRTLKDRHDLHQSTLGIIPAHIRDASFQVGRDDDGRAEYGRASSELVASFVNRSNPLKSWEKNRHRRGQCIRSVQAKKRGDQAHSGLILCHGSPPFF